MLLPLPLGPSMNTRSPAATSKRAMSMTSLWPGLQANRMWSISTVIVGSGLTLPAGAADAAGRDGFSAGLLPTSACAR